MGRKDSVFLVWKNVKNIAKSIFCRKYIFIQAIPVKFLLISLLAIFFSTTAYSAMCPGSYNRTTGVCTSCNSSTGTNACSNGTCGKGSFGCTIALSCTSSFGGGNSFYCGDGLNDTMCADSASDCMCYLPEGGFYNNNNTCYHCKAGHYCQKGMINFCGAGKYSASGAGSCTTCPANSSCPYVDNTDFICNSGYIKSGSSCIPISCNAGSSWNGSACSAVVCPSGTYRWINPTMSTSPMTDPSTGLSLNATSSGQYASYPAWKAFDKNVSSPYDGTPGTWLQLDTGGTEVMLRSVKISTQVSWPGENPASMSIEASTNASSYAVLMSGVTTPTQAGNQTYSYDISNTGYYRYLRLNNMNTGYTGIGEVEFTGCAKCKVGTYSTGNQSACTTCAAGSYQDLTGQSSCKTCPKGSYCAAGAVNPTTCPAGSTTSGTGSSSISSCTVSSCPANSKLLNGGTANAICVCSQGYNATGSASTCAVRNCFGGSGTQLDSCPGGGVPICSNGLGIMQGGDTSGPWCFCSTSNSTPDGNSGNCKCIAGSYKNGNACPSCAAGTYQDLTGQSSCKTCPAGSYCAAGAVNPTTCPAGSYCPANATTPTTCPSGLTSSAGSTASSQCICNQSNWNGTSNCYLQVLGFTCSGSTCTMPSSGSTSSQLFIGNIGESGSPATFTNNGNLLSPWAINVSDNTRSYADIINNGIINAVHPSNNAYGIIIYSNNIRWTGNIKNTKVISGESTSGLGGGRGILVETGLNGHFTGNIENSSSGLIEGVCNYSGGAEGIYLGITNFDGSIINHGKISAYSYGYTSRAIRFDSSTRFKEPSYIYNTGTIEATSGIGAAFAIDNMSSIPVNYQGTGRLIGRLQSSAGWAISGVNTVPFALEGSGDIRYDNYDNTTGGTTTTILQMRQNGAYLNSLGNGSSVIIEKITLNFTNAAGNGPIGLGKHLVAKRNGAGSISQSNITIQNNGTTSWSANSTSVLTGGGNADLYLEYKCNSGYFGSITCAQCPAGSYCPADATTPTACPTGLTSPAGSTASSQCTCAQSSWNNTSSCYLQGIGFTCSGSTCTMPSSGSTSSQLFIGNIGTSSSPAIITNNGSLLSPWAVYVPSNTTAYADIINNKTISGSGSGNVYGILLYNTNIKWKGDIKNYGLIKGASGDNGGGFALSYYNTGGTFNGNIINYSGGVFDGVSSSGQASGIEIGYDAFNGNIINYAGGLIKGTSSTGPGRGINFYWTSFNGYVYNMGTIQGSSYAIYSIGGNPIKYQGTGSLIGGLHSAAGWIISSVNTVPLNLEGVGNIIYNNYDNTTGGTTSTTLQMRQNGAYVKSLGNGNITLEKITLNFTNSTGAGVIGLGKHLIAKRNGTGTIAQSGITIQNNGTATFASNATSALTGGGSEDLYLEYKCNAGYFGAVGALACTICPAGSYCPAGSLTPTACAGGSYQDEEGQTSCKTCPLDFMCIGGGVQPEDCKKQFIGAGPDGFTETTGSSGCRYCPPGKEFNYTARTCDDCPAGQLKEWWGGKCYACRAGSYCPTGSAVPTTCPAGSFCPASAPTPTACAAGSYQDLTSQTSCKTCPAGGYCPTGAATPTLCPTSSYQSTVSATTSCQLCSAGTYSSDTGRISTCDTTCLNSGNGIFAWKDPTWNSNKVDNVCIASSCSAGYQLTSNGTTYDLLGTSCMACPAGSFKSTNGTTACITCSGSVRIGFRTTSCDGHTKLFTPGTYTCSAEIFDNTSLCSGVSKQCYAPNGTKLIDELAQFTISCDPLTQTISPSYATTCPAGLYLKDGVCYLCSKGFYKDKAGIGACVSCPSGYTTPSSGSSLLSQCSEEILCVINGLTAGQATSEKITDTENNCKKTVSATCSGGYVLAFGKTKDAKCVQCEAGSYSAGGIETECKLCPSGSNSPTGSNAVSSCVCNAGYEGNAGIKDGLCSCCLNGYYKTQSGNTQCVKCTDGYTNSQTCGATNSCPVKNSCEAGLTTGQLTSQDVYNATNNCYKSVSATCSEGFVLKSGLTLNAVCQCPKGYALSGSGTSALCGQCPKGTYNETEDSICKVCGTGKTTAGLGVISAETCISCAVITGIENWATSSWKYNTASNICVLSTCKAGYYKEENTCNLCPEGQFMDVSGIRPACILCARGSYSSGKGNTACTACQGVSTSDLGQTLCDTSCNKENVLSYKESVWSNNTVSNLCIISQCKVGYDLTANECKEKICATGDLTGSSTTIKILDSSNGCYKTVSDTCNSGNIIKEKGTLNALCQRCPENTYSAGGVSITCQSCPPNSSAPAGSSLKTTCRCNSGYFGANGDACLNCGCGNYCSGGHLKISCPENTFSMAPNAKSLEDCQSCSAGYTSIEGSCGCSSNPCTSGSVLGQLTPEYVKDDANNCFKEVSGECNQNFILKNAGSLDAVCQCPTGYGLTGSNQTAVCSLCEEGKFNDTVNGMCLVCSTKFPGFTTSNTGALKELKCGKGYYCSGVQRIRCPKNTTTQEETAVLITDCIVSTCGIGTMTQGLGTSTVNCISCPEGTYQGESGQLTCKTCPVGYTNMGTGNIYCYKN